MDMQRIIEKKNRLQREIGNIDTVTISSYDKDFELTFTHNSMAIEGNTLTLMETKVILEDCITIGGKELREIYEVINHKKAYHYVKKCIAEAKELNEAIVKDIHAILVENIIVGGVYRNQEVRISGAKHTPPTGQEMFFQIKGFYEDLKDKAENNPLELAAWTHAEFVRIHPFVDGNGRTSGLLMNYQLMAKGYLPVSIAKEARLEYYLALEEFVINKNLQPFVALIARLEEERLDE